jgi:hypothetical protein
MLSLYFYMVAAFILGFTTRSPGKPAIVYILYHEVFYWPIFGTGFVSALDFHVFYALAFLMHAVAGWMLAMVLNVPSLFSGNDGCCNEQKTDKCPKEKKIPMGYLAWIYRLCLGIVVVGLFIVSTLGFELIPLSLMPLGMIVSLVCLLIAHTVFWLAFSNYGKKGKQGIKNRQAIYVTLFYRAGKWIRSDMTPDVVLYFAIYYIPMTLVFCLVFTWASWWWQFWTAFIIFGFYFIFYLLAGLTWMNREHLRKNRAEMKAAASTKLGKYISTQQ